MGERGETLGTFVSGRRGGKGLPVAPSDLIMSALSRKSGRERKINICLGAPERHDPCLEESLLYKKKMQSNATDLCFSG